MKIINKKQISEIIIKEHLENIVISSTQHNNSFYNPNTNSFYIPEFETDLFRLFYNCEDLKIIKFENFNFSKVKSIKQMFAYNLSLEELDLSMLDTSNLENINGCFLYRCKLKHLKLPEFRHPIKSLYSTFEGCEKLEEIDLSTLVLDLNWDCDIRFLFLRNYKLKSIYLNKLELDGTKLDNNFINYAKCFLNCNPDINIFCKKNQDKIIKKIWDRTYYYI